MGMWQRAVRLIPAALLVAAPAAAQQTSGIIDQATFTLTRDGAPYGTETYRLIRRLGAQGVEYTLQCTRTLEGQVVRTTMTADSAGNATSYTRATTSPGQGKLTGTRAMSRLTVNEEGPHAS